MSEREGMNDLMKKYSSSKFGGREEKRFLFDDDKIKMARKPDRYRKKIY